MWNYTKSVRLIWSVIFAQKSFALVYQFVHAVYSFERSADAAGDRAAVEHFVFVADLTSTPEKKLGTF